MLWETYDGNTQFQGKLELWNMRLIFQTGRISDDGNRIVIQGCGASMIRGAPVESS